MNPPNRVPNYTCKHSGYSLVGSGGRGYTTARCCTPGCSWFRIDWFTREEIEKSDEPAT